MRPKKKVKLADIAGKMGVSVVTVSNALAHRRGVSPELQRRIEKCAAELGYEHTEEAREPQKETKYVSVLFPSGMNGSLSEETAFMGDCLKEAAKENQVELSYGILMSLEKKHVPDIRWITERKGVLRNDGILICGAVPEKLLRAVIDFFKVPVIGYGFMDPMVELDYLMDDGFRGIRKAVRHLVDSGCKDILYISETNPAAGVFTDRFLGFYKGMHECGLIAPNEIPHAVSTAICDTGVLSSRIRSGNPPEAVVCSSDQAAEAVVSLLEKDGYHVPEDVLVTGYREGMSADNGNDFFSSCVIPVPVHAGKCLELLRKRIERGGGPDGVRFLECEFSLGRSTDRRL